MTLREGLHHAMQASHLQNNHAVSPDHAEKTKNSPCRSQPAARKGLAYNRKDLVDLGPFKVSPIGLGKYLLHPSIKLLQACSYAGPNGNSQGTGMPR